MTHGRPAVVRRELDELRAAARRGGMPDAEQPWLLMEACPAVDALNAVLEGRLSPMDLLGAASDALDVARAALARIALRSRRGN